MKPFVTPVPTSVFLSRVRVRRQQQNVPQTSKRQNAL
jgi:hypothetical protein